MCNVIYDDAGGGYEYSERAKIQENHKASTVAETRALGGSVVR